MNTILLLAAALLTPSYEVAPIPYETEDDAILVARWHRKPAASKWVQVIGDDWSAASNRTETFSRPWRWWFRRTRLRFDGVEGDFKLTINGKTVAESTGAHPVVEFDVTDALNIFFANRLEFSFGVCPKGRMPFRSALAISSSSSAPSRIAVKTERLAGSAAKFLVLDQDGKVLKERTIEKCQLWCDELPAICLTPIEHHYGWWIFGGIEYRAVKFGFTDYRATAGTLTVDGVRVRLNPIRLDNAKFFAGPREKMRSMFSYYSGLVKSCNANAVLARDCPKSVDWFELCDLDGIYVLASPTDLVPAGHPCVIRMEACDLPTSVATLDAAKPAIASLKDKLRPVKVESFDWKSGALRVRNDYRFLALDCLDCISWSATDAEGSVLKNGEINGIKIAPQSTGELTLAELPAAATTVRFEFVREDDVIGWDVFKRAGK